MLIHFKIIINLISFLIYKWVYFLSSISFFPGRLIKSLLFLLSPLANFNSFCLKLGKGRPPQHGAQNLHTFYTLKVFCRRQLINSHNMPARQRSIYSFILIRKGEVLHNWCWLQRGCSKSQDRRPCVQASRQWSWWWAQHHQQQSWKAELRGGSENLAFSCLFCSLFLGEDSTEVTHLSSVLLVRCSSIILVPLAENHQGCQQCNCIPRGYFFKSCHFIQPPNKHLYSLIATTLRKTISKPYAQGAWIKI